MTRTRWAATALTAAVMLWSILYAPGSWAVGVPPAPAPSAPTPKAASQSAGTFVPIDPLRLWEHQDVGPGGTLTAHLSGLAEVPEGAIGAVVLNVTAYPLSSGYLTVYPSGGSRPLASSINYDAGRPVANLVTVKVGADGEVAFYNHSSGAAAIYADIQGYYLSGDGTAAGSLRPMTPVRVLDTRDGTGAPQRRLTNEAVTLALGGRYGVPTNASAVLLNVTAVETTIPGYVTASPAGEPRPTASALNFPGNGLTRAGATVVKLGAGGAVDLFAASTGRLDLVADLSGYYVGGTPTEPGTFVSLSPRRHLDQVLGGGQRVTVGVGGTPDIPADAGAVVTTLTVDAAQLPGWFRAMPSGSQEGTVSNLNFVERETRANLAVVKLGADGANSLMNGASGNARAVSDVSGYFRASTQTWPLFTASSVSTAAGTTCVLDTSRQVWCWGDNIHGQFGNGNRRSTPIPTRLRNLPPDVTQVRVSHRRVCVLAGPATGGDVYCSGAFTNDLSSSGQDMLTPVRLAGLPKITHLSLDTYNACALATDGQVWCWDFGSVPVTPRPLISNATTLDGMCAITAAGTATCMMIQDDSTLALTPVPVAGVKAAGGRCAANSSGVYCRLLPTNQWTQVNMPGGMVEIDNDVQDTCGRTTDGTVWCAYGEWASALPQGIIQPARQMSLGDRMCVISQANELRCADGPSDTVRLMTLVPVLGFH